MGSCSWLLCTSEVCWRTLKLWQKNDLETPRLTAATELSRIGQNLGEAQSAGWFAYLGDFPALDTPRSAQDLVLE